MPPYLLVCTTVVHGLRGLDVSEVKCITDRITATAVSCQEIPSTQL